MPHIGISSRQALLEAVRAAALAALARAIEAEIDAAQQLPRPRARAPPPWRGPGLSALCAAGAGAVSHRLRRGP
jgi:hypothetical protein